MEDFVGVDIKNIHIIIHKKEPAHFEFKNPSRKWDGFVLITNGEGYATTPDRERHHIKKGDILILRKGDKYEMSFEKECSYITSGYDLKFDRNKEFPYPVPYIMSCSNGEIKKIYDMCGIWQERKWNSYSLCRIMLIGFYLSMMEKYISSPSFNTEISKAISFIHENFKTSFSGEEIASHCSVSKSYLRSRFLKETGITITQYRDNLRINAAMEMLESQHFSVTEIAMELGYCDVYHFSKAFKKITGSSPKQYIQKTESR